MRKKMFSCVILIFSTVILAAQMQQVSSEEAERAAINLMNYYTSDER